VYYDYRKGEISFQEILWLEPQLKSPVNGSINGVIMENVNEVNVIPSANDKILSMFLSLDQTEQRQMVLTMMNIVGINQPTVQPPSRQMIQNRTVTTGTSGGFKVGDTVRVNEGSPCPKKWYGQVLNVFHIPSGGKGKLYLENPDFPGEKTKIIWLEPQFVSPV